MAKYKSSSHKIGPIPAALFVSRVADSDFGTRVDPLLIRSFQKPSIDMRRFEGKRLSPYSEDYLDITPLALSKASSQVCVSEIEFAEFSGKDRYTHCYAIFICLNMLAIRVELIYTTSSLGAIESLVIGQYCY